MENSSDPISDVEPITNLSRYSTKLLASSQDIRAHAAFNHLSLHQDNQDGTLIMSYSDG